MSRVAFDKFVSSVDGAAALSGCETWSQAIVLYSRLAGRMPPTASVVAAHRADPTRFSGQLPNLTEGRMPRCQLTASQQSVLYEWAANTARELTLSELPATRYAAAAEQALHFPVQRDAAIVARDEARSNIRQQSTARQLALPITDDTSPEAPQSAAPQPPASRATSELADLWRGVSESLEPATDAEFRQAVAALAGGTHYRLGSGMLALSDHTATVSFDIRSDARRRALVAILALLDMQ